ncbi:MAG: DUF1508 domain-containing protein [Flavobacteriales bacterium]|nr:DUF1508 domain-containing protein [Flavobacteriales bacterium]
MSETYPSAYNRDRGMANVMKDAPDASIVDRT